jgi:hypothetical protein
MKNKYKNCEFSFSAPIDHLLVDSLDFISQQMGIEIDKKSLEEIYFSIPAGKGNVRVYFSEQTNENFIMFDLYKSHLDQCEMVKFCVRCNEEQESIINKHLRNIYQDERRVPRSAFIHEHGERLLEEINTNNFPRLIKDIYTDEKPFYQEIELIVTHRRQ